MDIDVARLINKIRKAYRREWLTTVGSRLSILLVMMILLTGSGWVGPHNNATLIWSRLMVPIVHDFESVAAAIPAALTDKGLDLQAGPVEVPLRIEIPSLGVNASVAGVGITSTNVMDAPMGKADNPVWQQAFWYRGSAIPGELSTALIAGHVSDPLGRDGIFAHIDSLRNGDVIIIHDTRNGLDVNFAVTGVETYSLAEMENKNILTGVYGSGPVDGLSSQPSPDGLAHLTLVTCAGIFSRSKGTHDHRLVVYATRVT